MRNMRKALSFALILALVFTSVVSVHATHTQTGGVVLSDIAGLPGEEHIVAGLELGYIEGFPDGTFRPNEIVNRAQFAALITRAMGIPDSALLGHTTTPFLDTDGFGWAVPYLSFTHSRGIMLGDGHGNAMPGRTITMNEAMTMILRAIGYTEGSQELVGAWPANYVALATQHDLYRDIVGTDVQMTRQNAAIALFNALTVQMVYVDLVGRTDRRWISHQDGIPANLANTGLNAMTTRGVITLEMAAMPHMNLAERVGAFGWLFYDRHTNELIAFRQLSTFVTGFLNADNTRFTAGGTNFAGNFRTPDGAIRLFWNGAQAGTTTGAAMTSIRAFAGGAYPNNETDGRQVTMAVDISGATITNIYSILGWAADRALVASASDIRTIEASDDLLGASFPLNADLEIDYSQFQLIGVDCVRDIQANHVVYVYTDSAKGSDDIGTITRVAVGTEVVEGLMQEANDVRMIVDGRSINYARRFLTDATRTGATLYSNIYPHAGNDVMIRLDAFGNAFQIDIVGAEVGNFGIVLDATTADPRGQGVLLFTNDDASTFYSIVGGAGLSRFAPRLFTGANTDRRGARTAPQSILNGAAVGAPNFNGNAAEALNTIANTNIGVVPHLIGYGLNAAGNINMIEHATGPAAIEVRSRTVARINNANDVVIDADVAIFFYDGEWNVAGIGDVDLSWFRDSARVIPADFEGQQYVLNIAGNRIVAMTLPAGAVDATGDAVFALLNNWYNIAGGAQNLVGFFDGATTSATRRTVDDARPLEGFTRTLVSFWMLIPNATGQIRDFNPADANLVVDDSTHADGRFVTHYDNFATPSWCPTSLGLRVLGRDQVDAGNRFIALYGAVGQFVVVADDVRVYEATGSGGNIVYRYSPGGINDIRGNAVVWGFNTATSASDVTSEANVIIWMTRANAEARWGDGTPPPPPVAITYTLTGVPTAPVTLGTPVNIGVNVTLNDVTATTSTVQWQVFDGTTWVNIAGMPHPIVFADVIVPLGSTARFRAVITDDAIPTANSVTTDVVIVTVQ